MYLWCLTYYMHAHDQVTIILKKYDFDLVYLLYHLIRHYQVPETYPIYRMGENSLTWILVVPLLTNRVIQGMQFYRFIFLARSWSTDRIYLGKHLVSIAQRAQRAGQAFALLIFPEGTLVSQDTRPLSKKYADKTSTVSLAWGCVLDRACCVQKLYRQTWSIHSYPARRGSTSFFERWGLRFPVSTSSM